MSCVEGNKTFVIPKDIPGILYSGEGAFFPVGVRDVTATLRHGFAGVKLSEANWHVPPMTRGEDGVLFDYAAADNMPGAVYNDHFNRSFS